jgi:hypothetical protein
MVTTQDKIRFASLMINEGKINTIQALYKNLSKKVVAEILGVNSTRFSNLKSNHPGEFKINEVKKLSTALNVEFSTMAQIINNSLTETESLPA